MSSRPEKTIDAVNYERRRPRESASLLLEVGVPFRVDADRVYMEAQAYHGIRQWLANFDRLTLCAPVVPDVHVDATMQWISAEPLLKEGRLSVTLLPWAYDPIGHFARAGSVRRTFRSLIPRHSYLCFSNLGWLGAWGRIGSEEAYKLGRPFAVWCDWVLHEMPLPKEVSPIKDAWRKLQRKMLTRKSLRDVQRSSLGLFNGRTVYDTYAPLCRVPKVVYDIHLGVSDIISPEQLENRLARTDGAFKIVYVGRVHEMKGPRHWVEAIEIVLNRWQGSRRLQATWIGGGPLLDDMRQAISSAGLSGHIGFPGNEPDRTRLLHVMRDADLFVYCHLTPESPRCLIEALMSGLPIVGFENAYARDLVDAHPAGGAFAPVGDTTGLAGTIISCLEDSAGLRRMSRAARASGTEFSDVAVFKYRSDLIKELL